MEVVGWWLCPCDPCNMMGNDHRYTRERHVRLGNLHHGLVSASLCFFHLSSVQLLSQERTFSPASVSNTMSEHVTSVWFSMCSWRNDAFILFCFVFLCETEKCCLRMWMCCFTEIYYLVLSSFSPLLDIKTVLDDVHRELNKSAVSSIYIKDCIYIIAFQVQRCLLLYIFLLSMFLISFSWETVKGHFIFPNRVLHSTSSFTRLFVFGHDVEVMTSNCSAFIKWKRKGAWPGKLPIQMQLLSTGYLYLFSAERICWNVLKITMWWKVVCGCKCQALFAAT